MSQQCTTPQDRCNGRVGRSASCDRYAAQSRGALRLLRSSRYALTQPDACGAGASRSFGQPDACGVGECRNPQSFPHLRPNPANDRLVDIAVGKEGDHFISAAADLLGQGRRNNAPPLCRAKDSRHRRAPSVRKPRPRP